MKRILSVLALAGALCAAPPAAAADIWTAGDSHCVEVARLLGWKTVAKNGALTSDLPAQLARVPFGAFVLICSGTNDSASKFQMNLAPFYAKTALDVAAWRSQTIVWIGPSAIQRADWYSRANQIDGAFEALMEKNGVPYISIFTDPAMKPADGVHLLAVQYRALGWAGALQLHD